MQPEGRSVTAEVDLERLAIGYTHRPASTAALERAVGAVVDLGEGSIALDIGGGLGEHAAVWAARGVRSIVLDPSWIMVEAANRRTGVTALRARSQAVPLRNGVAALAYFHLSIHYGDWRRALTEARRTLRPDGICEIWTLGSEHHRTSNLARWFPSVAAIDSARFPEPDEMATFLGGLGMPVEQVRVVERAQRRVGDWTQAVRAGFVSTLQLVPSTELEHGLGAFHAAHPDPAETFVYELKFDRIVAQR